MSQRKSSLTDEQVAKARAGFDEWWTWQEISDATGVPISTVRGYAKREGWERPERTAEQRAAQTAPGRERMIDRWAHRRAREADEAGATAATVRAAGERAIGEQNPQMVRACGIFYGILVDKAQLLSGGATGRVDQGSPEELREQVIHLQDDLEKRRAEKANVEQQAAAG